MTQRTIRIAVGVRRSYLHRSAFCVDLRGLDFTVIAALQVSNTWPRYDHCKLRPLRQNLLQLGRPTDAPCETQRFVQGDETMRVTSAP
jgi:hypothetical protein